MTFFDSREPFATPGVADVDRVYRFAWSALTDAHESALVGIYQHLPGFRGYLPGKGGLFPYWFGSDERRSPHLTASYEPPGLQVTGILVASDFQLWHERFIEAIKDFPTYEGS